jgi:tRNA (Thr-GGU) A37 N-methylase
MSDKPSATESELRQVTRSRAGTIHAPWHTRQERPKRGSFDGPICSIIVDERWRIGLTDLAGHRRIQVLYRMHRARGRRGTGRGLPFS